MIRVPSLQGKNSQNKFYLPYPSMPRNVEKYSELQKMNRTFVIGAIHSRMHLNRVGILWSRRGFLAYFYFSTFKNGGTQFNLSRGLRVSHSRK